MEAPNPQSLFDEFLTPKPERESYNIIKEKKLKLKDKDEQFYDIDLKLFEKSIYFEASNEKDIIKAKYLINLFYRDFIKLNAFLTNFQILKKYFIY